MRKIDTKLNEETEKAIKFLVNANPKEGEKPVIFHSIKVGFYLYENCYNKEIVIVGLLHDLLEDSDTAYEKIQKEFGEKVAKLVKANSYDKNIQGKTVEDKIARYQQTLNQCLKMGKQALIVKAADILDNSYYYHLAPDKIQRLWLSKKMKDFIDRSAPFIKNETVWKDLNKQYETLSKK